MKGVQKGFTLVEIMSVMAIISLLAALAMPNLLRTRVNANEATAQVTLKTINAALQTYYFAQSPPSYPSSLGTLANASPPYIIQEIATNTISARIISLPSLPGYKGYIFRYSPGNTVGNVHYTYTLAAIPIDVGRTGTRYFLCTASGNILEVSQQTAIGANPGTNGG